MSTEKHLRPDQRDMRPGAISRRKSTGAYYDIHWETVEKPVRRGASFEEYWLRNCEPTREEAHRKMLRFGSLLMPFIVCPDCGNKRCPKATHHDNRCTTRTTQALRECAGEAEEASE